MAKSTEAAGGMEHRFIYNNDGTFILGNALHGDRPLTIEDVHDYVDLVADSQVTTFMICTNAMMPYYPSRVERSCGCPGPQDAAKGVVAPVSGNYRRYGENIRALAAQGTDIVSLCVRRARERGMEAFATMRMNDLHGTDTTVRDPWKQADFWLEHPECHMGNHPGSHADGALNFAHEAVRRYKLAMISEICGITPDAMTFS